MNGLDTPIAIRREEKECPSCGSSDLETRSIDQEFSYGTKGDTVLLSASVPVHSCRACGFSFTDHHAEDLRHEAVCAHLGVLSPKDIKQIRDRHKLTRAKFAQLSKLGEATLGRWERGEIVQNSAYDQYLRLLADREILDRVRRGLSDTAPVVREIGRLRVRSLIAVDNARVEQGHFELRRAG